MCDIVFCSGWCYKHRRLRFRFRFRLRFHHLLVGLLGQWPAIQGARHTFVAIIAAVDADATVACVGVAA